MYDCFYLSTRIYEFEEGSIDNPSNVPRWQATGTLATRQNDRSELITTKTRPINSLEFLFSSPQMAKKMAFASSKTPTGLNLTFWTESIEEFHVTRYKLSADSVAISSPNSRR